MSTEEGIKHDAGKPKVYDLLMAFPRTFKALAIHHEWGAGEYTPGGWKTVAKNRYDNAMCRHILDEALGEDNSPGKMHDIPTAWNSLARIELRLIAEERNSD